MKRIFSVWLFLIIFIISFASYTNVQADGTLVTSSTSLSFATTQSANPSTQSVQLLNTNSSTAINWTASKTSVPSGWFSISPSSGTLPANSSGYGFTVSIDSTGLTPGSYSGSLAVTGNYFSQQINISVSLTVSPSRATSTDISSTLDDSGKNIIIGQQVYYVSPGSCGGAIRPPVLRPYPSAAIFLSYYKNSWSTVIPASSVDMTLEKGTLMTYSSGTLVNDKGTVYLMSDVSYCNFPKESSKRPFPSAKTFVSLGYKWSNVISADISYMPSGDPISSSESHASGTLINDSGTIFYISPHGKVGITSIDEFNSLGFNLKDVVSANAKDKALGISSNGFYGSPIP